MESGAGKRIKMLFIHKKTLVNVEALFVLQKHARGSEELKEPKNNRERF